MKKKPIILAAIALGALLLLSLFAAPNNAELRRGSTYNRSPDGYGAWFASVQSQGISIQRWRRPLEDIFDPSPVASAPKEPITLLRVSPTFGDYLMVDDEWVKRGNVFVLLGVRSPVTAAPFTSFFNSPEGRVMVETRRRAFQQSLDEPSPKSQPGKTPSNIRLSDSYGPIVWEQQIGKGKIIVASTPHLAANAYQDEPGNFPYLTALVREADHPLWVDEFIHGYKDQEAVEEETGGSWVSYLAKTPLLLLGVQAGVIFLVAVWGQNRRLGRAEAIAPPKTDNSEAYIQALGSVLNKAESSEFVLQTIGRAEQMTVQRSLGLGNIPVEPETLVQAWTQQTGRPAEELNEVLIPVARQRRIGERDLLRWLKSLQNVRRHLP